MTNKFILAAAGGAPAEVTTDNLKVHYIMLRLQSS